MQFHKCSSVVLTLLMLVSEGGLAGAQTGGCTVGRLRHGRVRHDGDGEQVSFRCNPGYKLSGPKSGEKLYH